MREKIAQAILRHFFTKTGERPFNEVMEMLRDCRDEDDFVVWQPYEDWGQDELACHIEDLVDEIEALKLCK